MATTQATAQAFAARPNWERKGCSSQENVPAAEIGTLTGWDLFNLSSGR